MALGENFCLRLNEFGSKIKTTWQQLQIEKDFYDITLACEGGQIKSHKIIVSHSSPVLKKILIQNSNQNPIIYLRGLKFKHLENLINFMYQGEVTVSEEDLEQFLEVANDLKVRGLSEENRQNLAPGEELFRNSDEVLSYSPNEKAHKLSMEPLPKRKHRIEKSFKLISNDHDHAAIATPLVSENKIFRENNIKMVKSEKCNKIAEMSMENDNEHKLVSVSDRQFSCNICDKQYSNRANLRMHKASAHEGIRYPCDQCNVKPLTTAGDLRRHKAGAHEGIRYACDSCDYKASQKHSLKLHANKYHNT